MWPALLGALGGVAVALLARVPAFRFEARSRTRIRDLVALHKEVPPGASQRLVLERAIDDDLGLFLIRRQLDAVRRESRSAFIRGLVLGNLIAVIITAAVLALAADDLIANHPLASQETGRRWLALVVAYMIALPTVLYLRLSWRTYRLQRLARQLWDEGERYPISDEVLSERHPSLAHLRPKSTRAKGTRGG